MAKTVLPEILEDMEPDDQRDYEGDEQPYHSKPGSHSARTLGNDDRPNGHSKFWREQEKK